jgi:hypothetical protein
MRPAAARTSGRWARVTSWRTQSPLPISHLRKRCALVRSELQNSATLTSFTASRPQILPRRWHVAHRRWPSPPVGLMSRRSRRCLVRQLSYVERLSSPGRSNAVDGVCPQVGSVIIAVGRSVRVIVVRGPRWLA